jgi:chromate transporter
MILLKLFWSFFQVGLFSFGGGFASIPLIQSQMVDKQGWLSLSEFTDLITIAQMTPGPIAINSATFVGTIVAGLPGAIVATIGSITPSVIIVSILALIYAKYKNLSVVQGVLSGLRPAVVALIASAGLSIMILAFWGEQGFSTDIGSINFISIGLFAAGFAVLRKWKPSPIVVMLGTGLAGGIIYYFVG